MSNWLIGLTPYSDPLTGPHQEKRAVLASARKVLPNATERYRALLRASDSSLDYLSLAYPPHFLAMIITFISEMHDNAS